MLTEVIEKFGHKQDLLAEENGCIIRFDRIGGPYTVVDMDGDLPFPVPGKRPDRIVALQEGGRQFLCPVEIKVTLGRALRILDQLQAEASYMKRNLDHSQEFHLFPVVVYKRIGKRDQATLRRMNLECYRVVLKKILWRFQGFQWQAVD